MKGFGTRTKHIAGPSAKLVSDGNNNCRTGSIDDDNDGDKEKPVFEFVCLSFIIFFEQ